MIKILKSIVIKIKNSLFIIRFKHKKNVRVGSLLKINRNPIISLKNNGRLIIGDNVTLNSNNKWYHASMFNKVKLMADKPGSLIIIGSNTRIHGSCIHAHSQIKIGQNCLIAANCQIIDSNGHAISGENPELRLKNSGGCKPIDIGNNVWLGLNVIVLPGVIIGDNTIVAAGSIVTKNLCSNSIYAGNPAKFIKRIKEVTNEK